MLKTRISARFRGLLHVVGEPSKGIKIPEPRRNESLWRQEHRPEEMPEEGPEGQEILREFIDHSGGKFSIRRPGDGPLGYRRRQLWPWPASWQSCLASGDKWSAQIGVICALFGQRARMPHFGWLKCGSVNTACLSPIIHCPLFFLSFSGRKPIPSPLASSARIRSRAK